MSRGTLSDSKHDMNKTKRKYEFSVTRIFFFA